MKKTSCWLGVIFVCIFQIVGCISAAPWEFLRVADKVEGKTPQLPNYQATLNNCDTFSCVYVNFSCETYILLKVIPNTRAKISPQFEIYFVISDKRIDVKPNMYRVDDVGALNLEGKQLKDLIPSCDSRRNTNYALHITILPQRNLAEKIESGLTVNVDEPRPFHFSGTIY